MATIRRATTGDLDAIATYLAGSLRGGGPERYRRFFEYSWLEDKPDLGVAIDDKGKLGGFLGAIYSRRNVDGRAVQFCNIACVAIDEAYRALTLQAFAALLRAKDVTYTCFSPSDKVTKIFDFFKFKHRASDKVIVHPLVGLDSLRHSIGVRTITRCDELEAMLTADELEIARDHRRYGCAQVLLVRGDRRCHVVAVRRGRGARVFADVLYASDPAFLADSIPALHVPLFLQLGTVLTGLDQRWFVTQPALSFVYNKLRPTYVRSSIVAPDQVDGLYSELVPMYGRA